MLFKYTTMTTHTLAQMQNKTIQNNVLIATAMIDLKSSVAQGSQLVQESLWTILFQDLIDSNAQASETLTITYGISTTEQKSFSTTVGVTIGGGMDFPAQVSQSLTETFSVSTTRKPGGCRIRATLLRGGRGRMRTV